MTVTVRTASGDIDEIDRRVIQMFALVGESVAGATHALLVGDREAAKALVAKDAEVDRHYEEIEALAWDRIDSGTDTSLQTRYLVSVLRMLPEIERSGDLAEHVASRAARGLGIEMSARARGLVERMGEVACAMWRMAADAYGDKADAAERIDRLDDEMDDLHVTLTAEIIAGGTVLPVAIELAMIGRFYERLGDHAVNLARRVRTSALAARATTDPQGATNLRAGSGM